MQGREGSSNEVEDCETKQSCLSHPQFRLRRAAALKTRGCTTVVRADSSELVNAPTNCGFIESLAVHLLGFDLLAHGIDELVFLPECGLLAGKLDALFDEKFSVDVLRIANVLADKFLVGAMREHFPVQLVDNYIEVTVNEPSGLVANFSISFVRPLLFNKDDGLLHHRLGLILGCPLGGERGSADNSRTGECGR